MADYTQDAIDAYNDIKEDGSAIFFVRLKNNVDNDKPFFWEGNDDQETEDFEHVAVFFPLSETIREGADPFKESALIPGYGLSFPIEVGTVFRKADGQITTVTDVVPLRPDGVTVILYTCGVSAWRAI